MTSEYNHMTACEILAEGWRMTQERVTQSGMLIPDLIEFQIDEQRQIRGTRIATVDELSLAIRKYGDIERLRPVDEKTEQIAERVRQERAGLVELQRRVSRSGCARSTSVVEALFPDVPVKRKTTSEKVETEDWLEARREAGLNIDPETAEVDWCYAQTLDPYGVMDEWELPEEFHQVDREQFARSPSSDIWVWFGDLPEKTCKRLWELHRLNLAAGLFDFELRDDFAESGAE